MSTEFTVLIGVSSLMIIILGWLVSKIMADAKANNDRIYHQINKLNDSTDKLALSISGLNGTILSQEQKISNQDQQCALKHGNVTEKLNTHETRLNKHSEEIDQLKERIK